MAAGPAVADVVWRVVPLQTVRVLRRCARCDTWRPFASTDQFRLNAQQRRIDVWLIYGCTSCRATWNRTIIERATPEEIGADRYRRYLGNDPETAWRHAFDTTALRCLGLRYDGEVPVRVESVGAADASRPCRIRLVVPYACGPRLDRFLAAQLRISRAQLAGRVADLTLVVSPGGAAALRRPVSDGQIIRVGAPPGALPFGGECASD